MREEKLVQGYTETSVAKREEKYWILCLKGEKKVGELSFRQVVESGTNDKWELKACCKRIRGSF